MTGGQEQIAETQQTYDLIAAEFARQNSVASAEVGTGYRGPELTALLAATTFSIRNLCRHRAYRHWLSVHATHEPS